MKILLYGLQRSGTNYIEKVLTDHYRVRIINHNDDKTYPGAKHFRLYDNKNIMPEPGYYNNVVIKDFAALEKILKDVPDYYLVLSKDPYSWLESYEKWAAKCKWEKVEHHYIEEYNLFYRKWLELSSETDKIIFVRYIDLLRDIDKELQRLEKLMGLRKKVSGLFVQTKYTHVDQSETFTQEHLNYYLKEQYFSKYYSELLAEVNNRLDMEVISRLGYSLKDNI